MDNLERLARRAAAGDIGAARNLVTLLEHRGGNAHSGALPPGTLGRLADVIQGVANGGGFRPSDLDLAARILRGMAPMRERPIRPIDGPLSMHELRAASDAGEGARGVVRVSIDDVISLSPDGFLDMLSRLLTGSELLSDVDYKVVGAEDGDILIEVSGDQSQILDGQSSFGEETNG